jgi:hypothetical protein
VQRLLDYVGNGAPVPKAADEQSAKDLERIAEVRAKGAMG